MLITILKEFEALGFDEDQEVYEVTQESKMMSRSSDHFNNLRIKCSMTRTSFNMSNESK